MTDQTRDTAESDVHAECGYPWLDHDDDGVQMLCPEPPIDQPPCVVCLDLPVGEGGLCPNHRPSVQEVSRWERSGR